MPTSPTSDPRLRIAASLWSLVNHPSAHDEWSLESKVAAIAGAGFEGIQAPWRADLPELLFRHDLAWIGALDAGNRQNFATQLTRFERPEVALINAQLGDHDTPPDIALELALDLMSAADQQGVRLQIETHRDTATETPEKFATLAEGFKQATGRPLPVTWDHSHFALIKHLHPDNFTTRLITHDELLGRSRLLHCRPFNGHHCQIPVCHRSGQLTPEFLHWLQFMREVFRRWITSPHRTDELWVVPEIGAGPNGYHLSIFPDPWPEAQRCAVELKRLWAECVAAK